MWSCVAARVRQEPSRISDSSCPPPQPAYSTKKRTPCCSATSCSSFSEAALKNTPGSTSTSPGSPCLCSVTNGPGQGPPMCRTSVLSQVVSLILPHTSCKLVSLGRLRISPSAPSSVCCTSNTTE